MSAAGGSAQGTTSVVEKMATTNALAQITRLAISVGRHVYRFNTDTQLHPSAVLPADTVRHRAALGPSLTAETQGDGALLRSWEKAAPY